MGANGLNQSMSRKQFVMLGGAILAGLGLSACGGSGSSTSSSTTSSTTAAATGTVYYLNFKPEADEQWQALAKTYTDQTGVEVKVVTAASGTYEEKLKSEMSKSSAPTLFQVSGYVGLENWKEYCADLSGTDIYNQLTDTNLVLKEDSKVDAIGYVEEYFGIIYNKTLLTKAGYSESDITSFATLKKVCDDIQARKDELGVKGAFTSAGMDSSSSWRYTNHLADIPLYYEFKEDNVTNPDSIKGTYLPNYKDIFDLYITDSTCDKASLSAKTADDATSEFVNGEAVFYQNGTWAYDDIKALGDDTFGLLPIYIGVTGEEKQGICAGTENYWCVNTEASEDDQKATLDFMNWVVTSDEGTKSLADDMGFNCPFKSAKAASNPLVKIANTVNSSKTPVSWAFSVQPGDEYRKTLANALTAYAAGGTWDDVKVAFVDDWATEKAASASA
ncbi:MAG: ABC transporter substrate-binding protein [Atopobiaceae bacterium]|nr:ABC transporter substrate-binding protein [Atopobiaceae bacterium]MDD3485613.1 ABC transporter substrate-binding protein [Atopobiaceae bacterium]